MLCWLDENSTQPDFQEGKTRRRVCDRKRAEEVMLRFMLLMEMNAN